VNSPGDDKKRSDQDDKAEVLEGGMKHAFGVPQNGQIQHEHYPAKDKRDDRIILVPPVPIDEGDHRDARQEKDKWERHPELSGRLVKLGFSG
jgi:hypothetical protein